MSVRETTFKPIYFLLEYTMILYKKNNRFEHKTRMTHGGYLSLTVHPHQTQLTSTSTFNAQDRMGAASLEVFFIETLWGKCESVNLQFFHNEIERPQ